ncbi:MAG: peptidoglycan D,D-transpeptidase FtsI family protein [Qingshengfaniella sp.]
MYRQTDDSFPRRPLRPLARVIRARDRGDDPDLIERENLMARRERMRDRTRRQSEGRLLVLGLFFVVAFGTVGVRMGALATSVPAEPSRASFGQHITSARADITDRTGRILATNLSTQALYAHPREMVDMPHAVAELKKIFPDLDAEGLEKRLSGERKFVWIRRTLSPEQIQAVHDIGDPGLLFASRDMRLYPNGRLAAHVLGGAGFGDEGVSAAEVIGVAGIEKYFDARLRDPEHLAEPLQLSLDVTVQTAVREVLAGGMKLMGAKGASAIVMDVHTGEVIALASLPDFDPNNRPQPLLEGDQSDDPLFNRAVLGVYEQGSVFKIFTVANALEDNIVTPKTEVETKTPMVWGKHRIRDYKNYGDYLSARQVIVKSSNVGSAHMALRLGADRQREFLDLLGLLAPTSVELAEAATGRPILPKRWADIQTITISYGHGLSTSPMHLAAAYASLVNGGTRIQPTLLRQDDPQDGARVVSAKVSAQVRDMLRAVVTEGTASFAEVPGYAVGGKTGTADKPKPTGGYYKNKVLATFAGTFPTHDPQYVFVVTLDEAEQHIAGEDRRTAGWTTVPVAAEMIRRIAPLLDLRPEIEPRVAVGIREARNGG